ncbi:hypothetical protein F5Y10DRAFT_287742 [Nemania abortiva]|nr:hypothetical protein F5Y10DRAFT_287742 [Nemania abortiva]
MSSHSLPKFDRNLTPLLREVELIISGFKKTDIEDMIRQAYPEQCQRVFDSTSGRQRVSDEFITFMVERAIWMKLLKAPAPEAQGRPAEEFPWIFRGHPRIWEEGMPESREYYMYHAMQMSRKEIQVSIDAQAAPGQPSQPKLTPQASVTTFSVPREAGANVNLQSGIIQQDDLRLIHQESPREIEKVLIRTWPTLFGWTHDQDGQQVITKLHNIAAVVVFLRRMYAFWGGQDLSGGEPTALTRMAWKKAPLSKDTTPEEMQALFHELGLSPSDDPTFEDILQHDTMNNFWGTIPMLIVSKKAIRADKVITIGWGSIFWKSEMLTVKSDTRVEDVVNERANRVIANSTIQVLCNFPPFIRLRYQASRDSSSHVLERFSDLRRFRLRSRAIIEGQYTMQQEHDYVLIACFLKPDEIIKVGEVRLYSKVGCPLVPEDVPFMGDHIYKPYSQRRIGDPGVDCILLYGKLKHLQDDEDEDEACSELTPQSTCDGAKTTTRQIPYLPYRAPPGSEILALPKSGRYLDSILSTKLPQPPALGPETLPEPLDRSIQRSQQFADNAFELAALEHRIEQDASRQASHDSVIPTFNKEEMTCTFLEGEKAGEVFDAIIVSAKEVQDILRDDDPNARRYIAVRNRKLGLKELQKEICNEEPKTATTAMAATENGTGASFRRTPTTI